MKRDDAPAVLAIQPITRDVLQEKYLKPGETDADDLFARVARALASVEAEGKREEWEQKFLANLKAGAIGAGRIMSAAGTSLQATLINCFVQPVGDCIQGVDAEGYPGIYEALREAAETMRRGGGVGYDFSRIRPRGAEVRATASIASGPVQLHRRVRPFLLHGGKRRRAPRRADGRAAHRPPGRAGVHHRQAQARALEQLQRVGRRARRLHAGARSRRQVGAGAPRQARRRPDGSRRLPARGRPVGVPVAARGRDVGHGDEVGLRLRRARHPVPRHDQPRQQPALLREASRRPIRAASSRCPPTAAATSAPSS